MSMAGVGRPSRRAGLMAPPHWRASRWARPAAVNAAPRRSCLRYAWLVRRCVGGGNILIAHRFELFGCPPAIRRRRRRRPARRRSWLAAGRGHLRRCAQLAKSGAVVCRRSASLSARTHRLPRQAGRGLGRTSRVATGDRLADRHRACTTQAAAIRRSVSGTETRDARWAEVRSLEARRRRPVVPAPGSRQCRNRYRRPEPASCAANIAAAEAIWLRASPRRPSPSAAVAAIADPMAPMAPGASAHC